MPVFFLFVTVSDSLRPMLLILLALPPIRRLLEVFVADELIAVTTGGSLSVVVAVAAA